MAKKSGSAPWLDEQPEAEQPAAEEVKPVDVEAAIDALGAEPKPEPTEMESLQARIAELERQLKAAAVGEVTLGPTGTVIDFNLEELVIPTPQGDAHYQSVGECAEPNCHQRLFRCTTWPVAVQGVLGMHAAAVTPNVGDKENPLTYWCQRHDPSIEQRRMGVSVPVGQRATINGETWAPLTERQNSRARL